MRVLLFTGKGGVGKSTIAAATAVRCADLGYRTLALSTDPAHSLADALGQASTGETISVSELLVAREPDARVRLESSWDQVQRWLSDVWRWSGAEGLVAEELAVVPGLDEVFALCELESLAAEGRHDVVVVDCGPTAETLRLLSLPTVLDWYVERAFPTTRRLSQLVRPLVGRVSDVPLPDDGVFDGATVVLDRLARARHLLVDRSVTSVRLVVQPERVVLAEARRTLGYLSLFGYALDAVVANRVQVGRGDPTAAAWADVHAGHLSTLVDDFAPVPVDVVGCAVGEPCGIGPLRTLADELYGTDDPTVARSDAPTMRIADSADGPTMGIHLPFVTHGELDLGRRAGDLLVRVGPYRRVVGLPDTLRRREVAGATLVDGWLSVTFDPANASAVRDG